MKENLEASSNNSSKVEKKEMFPNAKPLEGKDLELLNKTYSKHFSKIPTNLSAQPSTPAKTEDEWRGQELIKNVPQKIYLVMGDEENDEIDEKGSIDFKDLSEVSWCSDKIGSLDIPYVLESRLSSLEQQLHGSKEIDKKWRGLCQSLESQVSSLTKQLAEAKEKIGELEYGLKVTYETAKEEIQKREK